MLSTTSDNLREMAKAMGSLSGAASLFGAGQLGQLLDPRPSRGSADVATRRLDAVTQVMVGGLGSRLHDAFAGADALQRGLVDLAADVLTLNAPGLLASAGPLLQPALPALDPVVAAVDRAFPGRSVDLRWRELSNKLEIYDLVVNAGARLGISPHERVPLPRLVERAYAMGPFLAMWAVEGLGRLHAEGALKVDPSPRGLLTGQEARDARPGSWPMLHAGIGLAFAQKVLDPLSTSTPPDAVRAAIDEFVRLCRDNSRAGYVGAAYESLGLVTRTFHESLVPIIDDAVRPFGDDLLGYYWHGVGRAIYFAPRNFLPCSCIDWARVGDIAPNELGRLNVVAGLAWATTLVNMRQPAILLDLVRRRGDVLRSTPAFGNGLRSAIVVRYDTTPDVELLDRFCGSPAGAAEGAPGRAREDEIADACRDAIRVIYPALRRSGRLGEVFHYREFGSLRAPADSHLQQGSGGGPDDRSSRTEADRMT